MIRYQTPVPYPVELPGFCPILIRYNAMRIIIALGFGRWAGIWIDSAW